MRPFEVFTQFGSLFVEAENEKSACWKAATLLKECGFKVAPSQLTAWEVA